MEFFGDSGTLSSHLVGRMKRMSSSFPGLPIVKGRASDLWVILPSIFSEGLEDNQVNVITEMGYILRRVELHGRKLVEGQSPWSIRQTAVYHNDRECQNETEMEQSVGKIWSTFILIAPSPNVERKLCQLFHSSIIENNAIPSIYVHALLVVDSMKGWQDYLAWLGAEVKRLVSYSCRQVLTSVAKHAVYSQ